MHLFTDYIEPLTIWLHANPRMALFFTFLISCAESLAIIGSIVPGSLTMTAIGILAGSGIMRIDLTLIAATFGAVAGDGISYALGYIYSNRLIKIWPFNKYPGLINYGKEFFLKHGGKSVIIGRFIGPLRSIIPVIAGIMNMPKFLFLFTNLISAIGWSILYIIPGYLIGTASNQLSTDGARKLFGLIILSILAIWIASKVIQKILKTINNWYNNHLDTIYIWSLNHPYLKLLFRSTDNANKKINGFTISLVIVWIFCVITTISISFLVLQNSWINQINGPISFFFQGIRTNYIDVVFIAINLITSPIPIFTIFFVLIIATIYTNSWRILKYLLSLGLSSSLLIYFLSSIINVPIATNLYQLNIDATFPVISLTWETTIFSFIICYLIEFYRNELPYYLLRIALITILCLSGVSSIYLGDNWFFSVLASYFIGLTISIMHWILFQRQQIYKQKINSIIIIAFFALTVTTWIEYSIHVNNIIATHASNPTQYILTEEEWWQQTKPILPRYTINRVGKQIGIFNVQYLGPIKNIENKLTNIGWTKKHSSIFYSLMMRLDGKHSDVALPVMEQLFLNKSPRLIMIYNNKQNNSFYILRLWRSNYHVKNYKEPIWIGSIIFATNKNQYLNIAGNNERNLAIFAPLLPIINNYKIISLDMPIEDIRSKRLRKIIKPKLLLINNRAARSKKN